MKRIHDMGGEPATTILRAEHQYEPWEKQTDAIVRILGAKKRMTVDELRRGIEELGPGAYDAMTYYERWTASVTNILIEKGIVTVDEIGRKMEEIAARLKTETAS